jgi:hypothetical protein
MMTLNARIVLGLLLVLASRSIAASSEPVELSIRTAPASTEKPAANLEPQVLDFRYAPSRWQTCIGLADDPHKSIVGSDGGLYYQYGAGRFEGFGERILADLPGDEKAAIEQSLQSPRLPFVKTRLSKGSAILDQTAWAGIVPQPADKPWADRRADFLWLRSGASSDKRPIVLSINSNDRFRLGPDGRTLYKLGNDKPWCHFSVAPSEVQPPSLRNPVDDASPLKTDAPPAVSRNWANPQVPCSEVYRDVMVGYGKPIAYSFRGQPGQSYVAAFGFIEGYYDKPGARPIEIRVEGNAVRQLEVIRDAGRNKPMAVILTVRDENNDGKIDLGVYSPDTAQDKNTILSGLWVFDKDNAPAEAEVISGKFKTKPLGAATSASQGQTVRMVFLPVNRPVSVLATFFRGAASEMNVPEDPAPLLAAAEQYWQSQNLPWDRIGVPDPAVQGLLDSCIRNIYQAREARPGGTVFQVGPTCYRGTWAADGPFLLEAATYLGRWQQARTGLELQIDKDDGPGGVEFSKKSGLRLWMVLRHWQLTGDDAWLASIWPKVQFNVAEIIRYRQLTRSDPQQANFGLMPIGFGDGGLGGQHREYTNVYWTLAGLRCAIEMARYRKSPQADAWAAEYADYWKAFDAARDRDKLTDKSGNVYVPVTMKGEQPQLPQRGAWAFLQLVFPGRIFRDDDALMLGTMAMLDANQREGLIFGTGWIADGIWNYAASFYAHAHLWLGHSDKAAATLYAFGNHASPLLCWREEQNPKGEKETFVGDMPHNWASAELIRLVRHLLILERGNELHLLEALPQAWTKPGGTIRVEKMPTSFGEIDLNCAFEQTQARIGIRFAKRSTEGKLVLHLERLGGEVISATIDGKDCTGKPMTIPPDVPCELLVQLRR